MPAELAVIVPTRGRPENIRKVIGAWDFTNAWDVADLILAVDADDLEIQGYWDLFEETRNPDTDEALFSMVTLDQWVPMVHKLDKVASNLAMTRMYFALGFAGDDHLPQTINWAKTYLTQLRELGTGMVYGDDGYQGRNLSTEWAITSDVVRAWGRMVPAPVEHMYSDVALLEAMQAAGAARHLPQVRIEHMHPIVGKAPEDAQYKRVNSREQFKRDGDAYRRWQHADKVTQVATIRALRPGRPDEKPNRHEARSAPVATRTAQRLRSGPTSQRKPTIMPISQFPFTREFKEVRGATPDEIGMTLADFATQIPADQAIVELGVFQGRTAMIMAWGAKQGHGAHVWGIDAWDLEGNTYGPPFNSDDSRAWAQYRINELGYADRITLVKNFASDAAAVWAEGGCGYGNKPIGLLFVDDDHDYSGARRAIEDWAPHLAEGAVIAIDDYGHEDWPGVKLAVDDLVDEGVLAPVTIYHERLAVTRLRDVAGENAAQDRADLLHDEIARTTAITSEGVSPSPVAAKRDIDEVDALFGEDSDTEMSTDRGKISLSDALKVDGTRVGQPVTELNTTQLRTLAKARGIVLGARKDKRDAMLQALADGE